MRAQQLYDLRERFAFCSGTDLHAFFRQAIGDPSPSGSAEIPTYEALAFVHRCYEAMERNGTPAAVRQADERHCFSAVLGEDIIGVNRMTPPQFLRLTFAEALALALALPASETAYHLGQLRESWQWVRLDERIGAPSDMPVPARKVVLGVAHVEERRRRADVRGTCRACGAPVHAGPVGLRVLHWETEPPPEVAAAIAGALQWLITGRYRSRCNCE
jgi:hypothetical protein